MPFPDTADAAWPPLALKKVRRDLEVAAAWYSGDPEKLEEAAYSGDDPKRSRFWSRRREDRGTGRQRLHAGLAGDVAQTSSNLLFGEEVCLEAPIDVDPEAAADALDQVAGKVDLHAVLPEAAEVASGLGGVFLRPSWDDDGPTLTVVQPDAAWPIWRGRRLTEVLFWRRLSDQRGSRYVWRLLELLTPGRVEYRLYFGDDKKIGVVAPLEAHPETERLTDEVVLPVEDRVLASWVPNMLPNRRHRGTMWGRPDTQGAEPMMDALDEAWTSLMRDVRLGQSRLVVPLDFLQTVTTSKPGRRGGGKGLDLDREIFTTLDMDPEHAEKAGIQQVQFTIRAEEHLRIVVEEMERVVVHAGYSPETFGLKETGRAESGTALRLRKSSTVETVGKKRRYWSSPIVDVVEALTAIDEAFFDGPGRVRPRLRWPDLTGPTPEESADILVKYRTAEAMSIETRVRRAQPDLSDDEVGEEVDRIRGEAGLAVEDPMVGVP